MITQAFNICAKWWNRLWTIHPVLIIDAALWHKLVNELSHRGQNGLRESGAFLLCDKNATIPRVTHVAYYDDLDPNSLNGNIQFSLAGQRSLIKLRNRSNLRVLADVHTHPLSSVAQSATDKANPMVAQNNHVAIILPHYGTRPFTLSEIGLHRYKGDWGWQSWYGKSCTRLLRIETANNDYNQS